MDSKTKIKLNSIARQLGLTDKTTDAFGKPVLAYDGVPIFEAGELANGTKIIDHNEVQGGANNTTSIYAVKYGADEFTSGLTNGGIMVTDLGELETKPVYRTRIEFYCGLALFNGKSAARLTGVIV